MSVDTAFVLGGGGVLGAHEVGMLRALDEAGIKPDVIVGTSVGALNGVVLAASSGDAVARLTTLWGSNVVRTAFAGSWMTRLSTLARTGTHLHSGQPLRDLLTRTLPVSRIEELEVPFQCVAASVERATAHWFTEGPWSRRCSPPAPSPDCCLRSASAMNTSSTAGWCTASPSAARSRWAPAGSTSCTWAGSSVRWWRRDAPGRLG